MSSSATSAEVGFGARAACASLIACCATAVALSRIDCGSEGFALTSVSNERAVCRRTTAEAKGIQFRNDAYKSFPKLYHVFVLPPISSPSSQLTALLTPSRLRCYRDSASLSSLDAQAGKEDAVIPLFVCHANCSRSMSRPTCSAILSGRLRCRPGWRLESVRPRVQSRCSPTGGSTPVRTAQGRLTARYERGRSHLRHGRAVPSSASD